MTNSMNLQEKIVTTIIFFLSLVEDFKVVHPVLVVVPISLIQNWEHELRFWSPKLNIVNYASQIKEARDVVRQTEFNSFNEPFKPQIVLTTFEVINCVRNSSLSVFSTLCVVVGCSAVDKQASYLLKFTVV